MCFFQYEMTFFICKVIKAPLKKKVSIFFEILEMFPLNLSRLIIEFFPNNQKVFICRNERSDLRQTFHMERRGGGGKKD